MSSDSRIPVLLVIDVEPDGFFIDRDSRAAWRGFEHAWTWVQSARGRLARASGRPAQFCWGFRLDSQVALTYGSADWPLRHYGDFVQDFLHHGDAVGVHTHLYRWDERRAHWVIEQGDPAWVEHNVRLSLGAFEAATGRRPDFFRFGDRWMSDAAMRLLDTLGVGVDLTLEPGRERVPSYHPGRPSSGFIPDQRGVPQRPYHPHPDDFRRVAPSPPTRAGVIEIPMTTACVRPLDDLRTRPTPANLLAWVKHRLRPWIDTVGLYHEPRRVRDFVDLALARGDAYLAIPVRTDTFARNVETGWIDRSLELLLAHPLAARFEFTTPAGLLRQLAPAGAGGATATDEAAPTAARQYAGDRDRDRGRNEPSRQAAG